MGAAVKENQRENRPLTSEQGSLSKHESVTHVTLDSTEEEDDERCPNGGEDGLTEKSGLVAKGKLKSGSNESPRRLSKLQLTQIGIMIFYMGIQLTLPYTISVYMVREFFKGDGHSEQKIAQLTGILAASQSFSRALTGYAFGIFVDRVGRKVGALTGILASIVSLIFYGAAKSYTQALIARSIPALLISGVPVAMKAMIGDACDEKGQAIALGMFNLGHGLGSTVGPLLGGVLADPCSRFTEMPFCGEGQLLQARPFLLPCLAGASAGIFALLMTCLLMKETHPELSKISGGWYRNLLSIICLRGPLSQGYSRIQDEETGEDERASQSKQNLPSTRTDIEMGTLRHSDQQKALFKTDGRHSKQPSANSSPGAAILQAVGTHNPSEDESSALADERKPIQEEEKWWRDKDTWYALVGSGLASFFYNFLDEMAPIYVSAPVREGGLAMPLSQFTYPLAAAGAFLIFFSLVFYPWMMGKYSPLTLCKFGMVAIIPFALMIPLASIVRASYIAQQVLIYVAMTLVTVPKICALGSTMVVINLVASKSAMGRINGAAVTLQSAGRALGPTLSGTTWAISVSLHVYGQQFLGFVFCAVGCALCGLIFLKIKVPNRSGS